MKSAFPVFLFLTVFSFTSCVDDIKENQEETQQAVEDIFLAQKSFTDGFDNMNEKANEEEDLNGFNGDADDRNCAAVTFKAHPDNFFPAVLTLEFPAGCTYNGHSVGGALSATFDGLLFATGKSMDVNFDAYTVDGYSLGGNYKLTNLGNNSSGQWQHEHKVSNGSLSDPNGGTFTYVGNTISTMVEGQNTNWLTNGLDGILDDVWEEDGTATYTNDQGTSYTIVTLSPLRRIAKCDFPVSGVSKITSANLNKPIEVDFGNGECDRKVTVTVGVLTFDMNL